MSPLLVLKNTGNYAVLDPDWTPLRGWWAPPDLNREPIDYEPIALTN
jgi:hypothetical protein